MFSLCYLAPFCLTLSCVRAGKKVVTFQLLSPTALVPQCYQKKRKTKIPANFGGLFWKGFENRVRFTGSSFVFASLVASSISLSWNLFVNVDRFIRSSFVFASLVDSSVLLSWNLLRVMPSFASLSLAPFCSRLVPQPNLSWPLLGPP